LREGAHLMLIMG